VLVIKNMAVKVKLLPVLLAISIGLVGAFVLTQLQFNVWLEPDPTSEEAPVIAIDPLPAPTAAVSSTSTPSSPSKPIPDGLRVSNQTDLPIRVVLLAQGSVASDPVKQPFQEPVHWDFAPMEGNVGGLAMSLPEGDLKLADGDVLMIFALDGSKRYWGPYVVGQTARPIKQKTTAEWQLILSP
jgi:hypothetical protein